MSTATRSALASSAGSVSWMRWILLCPGSGRRVGRAGFAPVRTAFQAPSLRIRFSTATPALRPFVTPRAASQNRKQAASCGSKSHRYSVPATSAGDDTLLDTGVVRRMWRGDAAGCSVSLAAGSTADRAALVGTKRDERAFVLRKLPHKLGPCRLFVEERPLSSTCAFQCFFRCRRILRQLQLLLCVFHDPVDVVSVFCKVRRSHVLLFPDSDRSSDRPCG